MIHYSAEQRRLLRDTIQILEEKGHRNSQRLFYALFPEVDTVRPVWFRELIDHPLIYSRDKYPRHMEFFEAGMAYRERCFMAANRVGKTMGGGYEMACHLTGEYPDWWQGKRFDRPIRAWAAGKTNETTRDILQKALCGNLSIQIGNRKFFDGYGIIPGDKIGAVTFKTGFADLADTVRVKHRDGFWSTLGFKAYAQGRGSFEGTSQHVVLFDEEPPLDVYGEALIRTATTGGIIMLTFTPLEGMSDVVRSFLGYEDDTSLDLEEEEM